MSVRSFGDNDPRPRDRGHLPLISPPSKSGQAESMRGGWRAQSRTATEESIACRGAGLARVRTVRPQIGSRRTRTVTQPRAWDGFARSPRSRVEPQSRRNPRTPRGAATQLQLCTRTLPVGQPRLLSEQLVPPPFQPFFTHQVAECTHSHQSDSEQQSHS